MTAVRVCNVCLLCVAIVSVFGKVKEASIVRSCVTSQSGNKMDLEWMGLPLSLLPSLSLFYLPSLSLPPSFVQFGRRSKHCRINRQRITLRSPSTCTPIIKWRKKSASLIETKGLVDQSRNRNISHNLSDIFEALSVTLLQKGCLVFNLFWGNHATFCSSQLV